MIEPLPVCGAASKSLPKLRRWDRRSLVSSLQLAATDVELEVSRAPGTRKAQKFEPSPARQRPKWKLFGVVVWTSNRVPAIAVPMTYPHDLLASQPPAGMVPKLLQAAGFVTLPLVTYWLTA